ncbi:M23 family metallopeptidase [Chloroflexus aggregans]|uniref:Peptidase M23 n=1 Tax=Chloroflexus aggregans (strain MD-66 / DSM 9485) TaxID=326427 RepID=B8G9V9_CHLAD|nr:M23 family metallopeptidase [Chloroflexus aggregans]ACL24474.1 Peptidase M23 [Chloroflexus aggregans DSM 9485]
MRPSIAIIITLLFIVFSALPRLFNPDQPVLSNWRGSVDQALKVNSINNAAQEALVGVVQPQGRGFDAAMIPSGNPLRVANTVMTQGYGVGTHAPAQVWGAVDLALDGDGDGKADPAGTQNQPVYATHAGRVTLTYDSWPAGNHIWVTNELYRTGYSHLSGFAVSDGQWVNPGDLIGYIGSTGMSSGPHLDYQVWVWRDGRWINQNPLDYGVFAR